MRRTRAQPGSFSLGLACQIGMRLTRISECALLSEGVWAPGGASTHMLTSPGELGARDVDEGA